jgi:hypothetical protein
MSGYRGLKLPLAGLVIQSSNFKCKDPRDHINASLGLAADINSRESDLRPNYTASAADVFKEFAVWMMKKNSLELFHWSSESNEVEGVKLPSWVPNFADLKPRPRQDLVVNFAASGTSTVLASPQDGAKLLIAGDVIDEILHLGTLQYRDFTTAGLHMASEGRFEALNTIIQHWRAWRDECKRIAFGDDDTKDIRSHPRWSEFWRTILCDGNNLNTRATPELGDQLLEYFDVFEDLDHFASITAEYQGTSSSEEVELANKLLSGVSPCLDLHTDRKLLCSTVEGRLGSMPDTARPGDRICIFFGGRVPYVIRPCGNEEYTLVGPCYLHGVMDGEAMVKNDLRGEIIKLV